MTPPADGATSMPNGASPTGEIVVLEVDGGHHLQVEHWAADMRRERGIVVSRRRVLRATTCERRLEPAAVVADLR